MPRLSRLFYDQRELQLFSECVREREREMRNGNISTGTAANSTSPYRGVPVPLSHKPLCGNMKTEAGFMPQSATWFLAFAARIQRCTAAPYIVISHEQDAAVHRAACFVNFVFTMKSMSLMKVPFLFLWISISDGIL